MFDLLVFSQRNPGRINRKPTKKSREMEWIGTEVGTGVLRVDLSIVLILSSVMHYFNFWKQCLFYSFIHVCIHFSPLPLPSPSALLPPCFQAEPVLPFSPILLTRRHKQ
jgi:hypothetical protein